MKTIAAIFIPLLVGLFVGGGLGYFPGSARGKDAATLGSVFTVADAAVAAGVLTQQQTGKLGTTLSQTLKVNPQVAKEHINDPLGVTDACRRIVSAMVPAAK